LRDRLVGAGCHDAVTPDRDGLGDREALVDSDDLAV
jgi:hypothetical protein